MQFKLMEGEKVNRFLYTNYKHNIAQNLFITHAQIPSADIN